MTDLVTDAISGAGLKGQKASAFLKDMLEAYPSDPAIGAPFDGRNTTYGVSSQFKRQAAIETDLTFAEGYVEFLETFSARTKTWGMIFEQPVVGIPAYGVAHGSDLVFYFPELVGPKGDPRNRGWSEMMYAVHDAVINFVNFGDPNGCDDSAGYRWPDFSESGLVTALNGTRIATAVPPPHRPGFDVIHKYLRPGPVVASDR